MEIVHVLNRGVDKRKIFLDKQDHFRFIHDLFVFNNESSVNDTFYTFKHQYNDVGHPNICYKTKGQPREMLVDILVFCLMPNHYHLLLRPRVQDGIALFIKKLNGGYAKYFNIKYKRKGTLFEGRYKRIVVQDEAHFIHLPYYIHLNPLDLVMPEWRQRELRNSKKAINFLEKYRWSSHLDYLGKKNFPSVTSRKFLLDFFGGHEGYKEKIEDWLNSLARDKITNIKELILEGDESGRDEINDV